MTRKDAPLLYLDTHAGAGEYLLNTEAALKNREFESGVMQLLGANRDSLPVEINDYLNLVIAENSDTDMIDRYPGSPRLAMNLLRPKDRMVLCELHNTDLEALKAIARPHRRTQVEQQDGLKALLAVLPPIERRALVLIDPSYEIKSDYQQITDVLHKAWRKFPQGTYLLWYPLLPGAPGERMCEAIVRSGIRDIQQFELQIAPRSQSGMVGSGMLVINPPWVLMEQMQRLLPVLAENLGEVDESIWKAEVRAPE